MDGKLSSLRRTWVSRTSRIQRSQFFSSMVETLFEAYTPLIVWTGLGLIVVRLLPETVPKTLGHWLYWVGCPLQILMLARQANFSTHEELAPLIMIMALTFKFLKRWLLQRAKQTQTPEPAWLQNRGTQGSFLLAATIGNTGFVGLGLAQSLIATENLSWAVSYSVAHNLLGAYGLGVILASLFSHTEQDNHWWIQLRDIVTVPAFWAFGFGILTRTWHFPLVLELGLKGIVWCVIPSAFLLIGVRLSQIKGWGSLRLAFLPAVIKVIAMPALVGLGTNGIGLTGDPQLSVVLMAGMPTAFIGLVLAEEYDLDRQLIASCIALTTGLVLIMVPVWLLWFH
jgi:malate permease and related proteins